MKITVVFDSLEEFQKHMTTGRMSTIITPEGVTIAQEGVIPCSAEKPQEDTQEPVQEAAAAPEEPKAEKKPKEDPKPAEGPTEDDRVKIRKQLADLNKKAGKNVAKELIQQVGAKKLTDVPLGALPTLQNLIDEEAKRYA